MMATVVRATTNQRYCTEASLVTHPPRNVAVWRDELELAA